MNVPIDQQTFGQVQFGIGQPVHRAEDPVLVRGEGRYTDDIDLPDQVYAAFVRSPHAHGHLKGIDVAAARAMPGVLGVFTAADLAPFGYGLMSSPLDYKSHDGSPMIKPGRPVLATDKVRFAGEILAFVVATALPEAQDAAEAVVADIAPLDAITDLERAADPAAPQLFEEAPGNLALDHHSGDSTAVSAAFAAAAHVTRLKLVNNRIVVNAMEPRAGIGDYDPETERFTFHVGCQGVFGQRAMLAAILGIPVHRLRILTGHVGGSFGMKSIVFAEYVCLLHAARALGRPVKWVDRRSDSFLADTHGRDYEVDAELALDADGRFLAVRASGAGNMGAYMSAFAPLIVTINVARHLASVYRTPLIEVRSRCLYTNMAPVGAYRGAGRPEGNYIMERLVDTAARQMGLDPVELRRRNHVAPQAMPHRAASGVTYDSGDFPAILDAALDRADWHGFAARREASQARGKLRGRGIGQYLEITAPPMREAGNIHFEADGSVTLVTGTLDYGQGHWTPFAQVLVEMLGVPFRAVRLVQGDSDRLQAGGGTGGSKSIMASGAAIMEAAQKVIDKGRLAASHLLEAAPDDIEFFRGRFTIAGTDRSIGIIELAQELRRAVGRLPPEVPATLDTDHVHDASPSAFPNGCHIAEVEVDPDTGGVAVVKYTMVNDFGTIVNPRLVEGQLHGGVLQGIGQALLERTVYDAQGQLVTGSFMDYALPRADAAPDFIFVSRPVPARTNPLGAKGCGEAGCAGSLPAVMNALIDALSIYGILHIDMPATPQAVWRAIAAAREGREARGE